MLRELADIICFPLSDIFRKSFRSGQLPDEWKQASICPIFKKGNASDPANYRPVNLTCIALKVMETIIKNRLTWHLTSHDLLNTGQHGFRHGRSCLTNLLTAREDWCAWVNAGLQVDVVFVDFFKAFDSVNLDILEQKLVANGVSGELLIWLTAFLRGRQH